MLSFFNMGIECYLNIKGLFLLTAKKRLPGPRVLKFFGLRTSFHSYLGSQITYVYVIVLCLLIFTVLGIKTNF